MVNNEKERDNMDLQDKIENISNELNDIKNENETLKVFFK